MCLVQTNSNIQILRTCSYVINFFAKCKKTRSTWWLVIPGIAYACRLWFIRNPKHWFVNFQLLSFKSYYSDETLPQRKLSFLMQRILWYTIWVWIFEHLLCKYTCTCECVHVRACKQVKTRKTKKREKCTKGYNNR